MAFSEREDVESGLLHDYQFHAYAIIRSSGSHELSILLFGKYQKKNIYFNSLKFWLRIVI